MRWQKGMVVSYKMTFNMVAIVGYNYTAYR